jgi:hypothetical protein
VSSLHPVRHFLPINQQPQSINAYLDCGGKAQHRHRFSLGRSGNLDARQFQRSAQTVWNYLTNTPEGASGFFRIQFQP